MGHRETGKAGNEASDSGKALLRAGARHRAERGARVPVEGREAPEEAAGRLALSFGEWLIASNSYILAHSDYACQVFSSH